MKIKIIHLICALFYCLLSNSQSNTEIHLFYLNLKNDSASIQNPQNISNNIGYDSQPYFESDRHIIFTSNRKGQTDIATYYDIAAKTKKYYEIIN